MTRQIDDTDRGNLRDLAESLEPELVEGSLDVLIAAMRLLQLARSLDDGADIAAAHDALAAIVTRREITTPNGISAESRSSDV